MIVDIGLNRVKTLINNDITICQAGISTTVPAASQTALISIITAANFTAVKTISDKSIQVTQVIDSTIATTSVFTEWAIRMNSITSNLFTRGLTSGISHTGNDEITKITTIYIDEA